ncbi:MAG: hypothetical protein AABZ55_07890, partial [Bdellovibrionota bacterium]
LNGGHCPRLVEPSVMVKKYTARWFWPEIDLNELALLRFKKGWTLRRIAAHLQMPKTNIVKKLKKLEGGRRV